MSELIFICHRWRNDPAQPELDFAQMTKDVTRELALGGDVIPISTGVHYNMMLDDNDPHERARGIDCGIEVLKRCDAMWVYRQHGLSEGMLKEITFCESHGIKIETFDFYPWEVTA